MFFVPADLAHSPQTHPISLDPERWLFQPSRDELDVDFVPAVEGPNARSSSHLWISRHRLALNQDGVDVKSLEARVVFETCLRQSREIKDPSRVRKLEDLEEDDFEEGLSELGNSNGRQFKHFKPNNSSSPIALTPGLSSDGVSANVYALQYSPPQSFNTFPIVDFGDGALMDTSN